MFVKWEQNVKNLELKHNFAFYCTKNESTVWIHLVSFYHTTRFHTAKLKLFFKHSVLRFTLQQYTIHERFILNYRRSVTTKNSSSRCWMSQFQTQLQQVAEEDRVEPEEWEVVHLVGVRWAISRSHHRKKKLLRGWGGAWRCPEPVFFIYLLLSKNTGA